MSLEDLKNRIKSDLPISTIIGQYLALHRQGSGLVAICPFHDDTKPSMNVNDSRGMYKCFACNAGGDAITFVQKYQKLEFIEALKEICQKNGINFDAYKEEKRQNPKMEMAKRILSLATRLYRETAKSKAYPHYNEFIIKRAILDESATTFSLGYAPSKNALTEYLKTITDEKDRKFARDIALEIGIIKKDRNNPEETYDTFRDRIMFPIWDSLGVVIGFTSRAVREGQIPKYLNSTDSLLFNKGNLLYGFHLAKSHIREKDAAIVVEGNMDQLALYQYGFKNAVAIQGTALGEQALQRLIGLTKNIYIALDNDAPGYKAAERMNNQLLEKGIIGLYVNYDPVKDADEFLKAEGGIKLQERLDNARPMVDVILDKIFPEKVPELVNRKLDVLNKAFEVVKPLGTNLEATERLINFAKRLGLTSDAGQIRKSYEDYLAKNKTKPREFAKAPVQHTENESETLDENLTNDAEFLSVKTFVEPIKPVQLNSERLLLQELVQNPHAFSSPLVSEILDLLPSDEVKKYITRLKRLVYEIDEGEYSSMVSNLMSNEEVPLEIKEIVSSALYQYKPRNIDEKVLSRLFFDLKIKIKAEILIKQKEDLKKQQDQFQTELELNELLSKIGHIEKELQVLKKLKHK
ncbi:MAG: DNA primase [Bacteriovoracaceae bacterium]|nr:DNA primase [Bacteriovoracaceae bacterium]